MKALFTKAAASMKSAAETIESARSKTKATLVSAKTKTKETLRSARSKTKETFKKVVNPLLPTYQVICTNYHLIPGQPLITNHSKHSFEGLESKEANEFYSKVVSSEYTKMMAPIEIRLKRAGITLKKTQLGKVEELKKFDVTNLN